MQLVTKKEEEKEEKNINQAQLIALVGNNYFT